MISLDSLVTVRPTDVGEWLRERAFGLIDYPMPGECVEARECIRDAIEIMAAASIYVDMMYSLQIGNVSPASFVLGVEQRLTTLRMMYAKICPDLPRLDIYSHEIDP